MGSFKSAVAFFSENGEDCVPKITLANKKGYTESYIVFDSLTLNDEKLLILRPIKENSNILIARLRKIEGVSNNSGYFLIGVDEFLASLY